MMCRLMSYMDMSVCGKMELLVLVSFIPLSFQVRHHNEGQRQSFVSETMQAFQSEVSRGDVMVRNFPRG